MRSGRASTAPTAPLVPPPGASAESTARSAGPPASTASCATPSSKAIHTELAGRLHNGGFPVDRDIYYGYDHTNGRFACKSTKSVIILSDMTRVENGRLAVIPGSHKANFRCPFDMEDASRTTRWPSR